MICVYPPDCIDFSSNGSGTLSPLSASVTETLNGEYELELAHPIDDAGKWSRLVEGAIIRAPVPAAMTPRINLAADVPGAETMIYRVSTSRDPLRLRSGPGLDHTILSKYAIGTEVVIIEKTNAEWYEVSCPDGKRGYMSAQYLTHVRTETVPDTAIRQVVEPRQQRDQPFRIYRVVPELDRITVYARHVFYDLMDNMIQSYRPLASTPGAAVAMGIGTNCLSSHHFTIYSDLVSTAADVEFVNINPVEALLGEEGVIEKYGGELARDWFDVYVVKRVGHDTNVQIRQGKNLLGVSYDVDLSGVTTRIMPTGEDENGNILYLPETYVDSPHINDYPVVKWIHLPVDRAKEVTKGDGKEIKIRGECFAEMRQAAQDAFDGGCDLPTVTLNVDFIDCANTEEYRPYGFLQTIYLGDAVRVIAPRVGIWVSMRMTQYVFDCLTGQYTSVTLGTVADTIAGNMISARQLPSGIITGSKLAINSVGAGQLQGGSVGAVQIRMAAIQTAHIEDAAVSRAKIGQAAVGSAQIEDAAVIRAKIAEGAIGEAQIGQAVIDTAHIKDGAIGSAKIEEGSINTAHIGKGQIQEANIADAAITSAKIGQGEVKRIHIEDGSVDKAKIADASIDNAKIDGAAIGTANIQNGAIVTAHILDGQVTRAKIADLAVDSAKIADLAVTTAKIAQAAITNAQIANAAVDTAQIALGAITAALIAQGAVGTAQIADASITEAKIVSLNADVITSGTLATERLIIRGDDGLIYEINAQASGLSMQELQDEKYREQLNGTVIVARSITADQIAAATITANEILSGTITGDKIAAATIEGSNIKAGAITTSHVSADFGQKLDLSSNEGINLRVERVYSDMDELVGLRIEIISTSDILSEDIQNTTLTARVWHGSQNVTADIPATRFRWRRKSADSTADAIWNNAHTGMKSITLTTRDVLYSATYDCELLKEE